MNFKGSIQKRLRRSIYSAFPFDDLKEDEKYISIFTSKGQLPNGRVFEYNHYNNENHCVVPNSTSNILDCINEFKTLYEHAAYIEDCRLTNFHKALLSIKELWKLGLLISQSEFLNKLSNNHSENVSHNIDTLGWITRDRPDSIKKSVESFIESLNEITQKYNFIVFDDSTVENYNKNKRNIEFLNKKYQIQIKLVGENERKEFLIKLSKKLENRVPKHVVEYGLMGLNGINHRTGANRNAFLLFTTGKFSLLTDDDIFCQISKNGDDEKLTITSDASYADVSSEFFIGQEELNNKLVFDHHNPVNIHQKLLGHSMGGLIQEYRNQINLTRIIPNYIVDNLNTEKKVRITMMGAAGDSGAGSPILKIFVPSNNLVPLISDTDNFLSKMYSRTVLQSHKSLTVGSPRFLLGMNLGFDNTELLPPFHPNFRNSDGIFASVLKKCFSNAYIGHLPYAISHIPPYERPVDVSDLTSTSSRIPDVLMFSINEFKNTSITVEGGLKSLGVYLSDISKRSDNSLNEYFKLVNTNIIISKINHTEELYKKHKHINKQWAAFVEQRIETLYNCLQGKNLSVQFKETENLSSEKQLLMIRNVYGNFGDLIYYWLDIYTCVETHKKILID
ncbi:hypothetical protein [Maribellus maritimus]|uniref:hypothetical protein n=1 Tax=Maribellus maritimus TaxID=2870838 RepID=UPI001EEAFE71|nr:hypothetical protein [Maribellus maritimus]MCG6188130.1 hypothetical protein [Maribellus maritimus]